jgi:hypothetical protein
MIDFTSPIPTDMDHMDWARKRKNDDFRIDLLEEAKLDRDFYRKSITTVTCGSENPSEFGG